LLTGLVKWVALSTTHGATSHLSPQVSLSGTQSGQSSENHSSNNNTGDSTSGNDASSGGLIVIQEACNTTVFARFRGGKIRDFLSVAFLLGTVANANVAIGIINDASPREVHTPNGVITNGNGAPICRCRANTGGEIATRSRIASSGD